MEIWQCDAGGRYSEYSQPGYDPAHIHVDLFVGGALKKTTQIVIPRPVIG
ncbi:MAG: hypothetical protein ABJF01_18545 [bacterium]